MYGELFRRDTSRVFNFTDLMKKNHVIAHPDDYIKMAESGMVRSLVNGGIKVSMSDLCEKGKVIVTGELAIKLFNDNQPTPPGAE